MYPVTAKGEVEDSYFGTKVADPYRWLEDNRSADTLNWVEVQNKVTAQFLEEIPYREKIKERLESLWNYEKVGRPFKRGDYTYLYKQSGLQNQRVLYRKKEGGNFEVFLDPNTFSEDGTISLGDISFTKDGSLAAYSISEGGSDWRKVIIIDTETKKPLEEPLQDVKFSGLSWKGREGFYYSSYKKPDGSRLSAKTDNHLLYYHKLGTPQTEDKIIFGDKAEEKRRYAYGAVTEDSRYLFLSAANTTNGNELYIKDLEKKGSQLTPLIKHKEANTWILHNEGSKLYLTTDLEAPMGKVVTVDASSPSQENWKDFIPETENTLSASSVGGYFLAHYTMDALSKVYQYDLEGKKIREIKLPGPGSVGSLGGRREDKTLYYSFSNYKMPSTIFKLDLKTGDSEVYHKSESLFDSESYESKQVFYHSKDGTKIPMMITHKKGLKLDGKNPTILYGYGGFNYSLTPYFSLAHAVWMELGGIYAVPNIRGGGEYGRKWHQAGIKTKKQNVFDDFIAAAEYLIHENYTSSDYLALSGASNGGLLVGAVMTQRPELMKVALPAVGVLDMLRYHTFTAGAGWAYDYGTSQDSKEMFEYLKHYSPLHNVREGTHYPATLITTGDHDDRVVPAHSFKFAAELQSKQAGANPTLIRIETDAGHGAGTPTSKIIEQQADIFSFTLYNMGVTSL